VNSFHKEKLESYKEEWMDYLKNERIRPDTTAPGLREAKQRLDKLAMTDEERREYEHYMDTLVRDTDVERTKILEAEIAGRKKGLEEGRAEGSAEGSAEGRAEGREERTIEIARRLKAKGNTPEEISFITDLTIEEIENL
jgi:flagellar biosynthesis/type III secretory pathway protein FliH